VCIAVPSLLAVHAHPDDETITLGGTLARYAAEGVRTIVVTCTRGDLGEVRDPSLAGADVGALRERELTAATQRLGVGRLVTLGYGDSGMAGWASNDRPEAFSRAPLDEAAARIVAVLEEERPEVMVAYDETGGYGHPDHVRAHEVAVAAYRAAPTEVRPARLYFVRFPLSASRAFVRGLREAGIEAPGSAIAGADAGPEVAEIGVPDTLVTTRIDIRAFVPQKRAALACHASQMPPSHFLMRMPPALAETLWHYEYFSLEAQSPPASPPSAQAAPRDDLFA
jgi:LmbE family N-acetylglucosaminyl deacetylase